MEVVEKAVMIITIIIIKGISIIILIFPTHYCYFVLSGKIITHTYIGTYSSLYMYVFVRYVAIESAKLLVGSWWATRLAG